MNIIAKNEVNTKRQFEIDFAKAVCILGMVIIHCLEELPLTGSGYDGGIYYTFVTVLDAIFGAGIFMICLGIGISYTNKNNPNDFIKRGLIIFLLGYVLNIFRFVLPCTIYFLDVEFIDVLYYLFRCLIYTDIMQFAGLAFILFGLLKKIKLPDWSIGLIALILSIIGTFIRFISLGDVAISEVIGLFIGTVDFYESYIYYATFPLINWFIFVVFGYFFGELLKRVENKDNFYLITTITSSIILIIYMAIAIPNKYGMMCGEPQYYFQMTTLESVIIMNGAVFAFGLYHFISKLFNSEVKDLITRLSTNINKTYCIHWVIIGFLSVILPIIIPNGIETYIVIIIALLIYIISSLLAEIIKRKQEKKVLINETKYKD